MAAPSKSCPLDPLPTSLLKKGIDVFLPCISSIINLSLEAGEFPAAFKHGLVTPLLKKSDLHHEILKNYRPISNLPFLGKMIERVVAMQFKHHLVINDLYTKTQSAYRPYHSTETALLRLSNDINLALDNHDVVLVLLDLSSAFDTIDRSVLMDRLYTWFGLRGTALAWIKSYLTNCSQAVVIRDVHSFSAKLICGVPQGSVLHPLLFSLYVAPIEDIIIAHGHQSMIFADDTQMDLVMQRSEQSSCLSKLELCAQDILAWMAEEWNFGSSVKCIYICITWREELRN